MTTPAQLKAWLEGDIENFMVAATPGGIEEQEREGRDWLLTQSVLPIDSPKEQLKALGFRFDETRTQDSIFMPAQFPEGWFVEPTSHPMNSDLVDSNGRVRGNIFYKAAFYDQHAHLRLFTRYHVLNRGEYDHSTKTDYVQFVVFDNQTQTSVYETERVGCDSNEEWLKIYPVKEREVKEWLDSYYPDSKDVLAYWT